MNSQFSLFHGGTFQLRGEAKRLASVRGELRVLEGHVWLTRSDQPGDHFLSAGEHLVIPASANAVIEPTWAGERTAVSWRPRTRSTLARWAVPVLSGLARGSARLAEIAARAAQRVSAEDGARRGDQPICAATN